MTDKIEKLTPEQEALVPVYRQRYFDIGWSTDETDREAAEKAMRELHEIKGWDQPEIVWFQSPYAAVDTIIESSDKDPENTDISMNGPCAALDAVWGCFYKFGEELKPDMYKEEDSRLLDAWDRLCKSCGPCWLYTNYVLMTDKPVEAHYNDGELVHCDTGPALRYSDGHEMYAIDGVRLPRSIAKKAVMSPWEMTLEEIEDSDLDEDVRTILQDRWCYNEIDDAGDYVGSGGGRFLKETGAVSIHEDVYKAYKDVAIMRSLLRDKYGRKWLMCADSSTTRVYYIRVDDSASTCEEGHMSINGGTPDSDIQVSS